MDSSTPRRIVRYGRDGSGSTVDAGEDLLVTESPVEFRLGEVPIAVLMRTPGDDAALGLGFAITEGIVLGPSEVTEVTEVPGRDQGDRWVIGLAAGVHVDPEQFRRNLYTTSSCGVCGKASIDAVRVAAPELPAGPTIDPDLLLHLPEAMYEQQTGFQRTGGLHAAALFSPDGELEVTAEDIGRHNAVDKVVGHAARSRWPIGKSILLVSGRVSFEMVQKAGVAGIPVVCGVSAVSSLAAELGDELGTTVIGFLRSGGFNVYAGAHRLA
jgi:FdhD protein